MKFPFKKNQRIGCIGDSITAVGQGGYVALLQAYFDTNYEDYNLTFVNLGISGETITGLTESTHPGPRPYLFDRLEKILDENNLDVAFFYYGINCGIYSKPSQLLFEKYKNGVSRFLDAAKARGMEVILLTPSPMALSEEKKNELKAMQTEDYSWIVPYPEYDSEVIQEFKKIILETNHPAVFSKIDIHTPLKQLVDKAYDKDPIHPNPFGHQLIADTIISDLL